MHISKNYCIFAAFLMDKKLLHRISPDDCTPLSSVRFQPFALPPHPMAQAAAREVTDKVRAYMRAHKESELHQCGKMFGVLIVKNHAEEPGYLAAFSARLDGSYHHEGFVPPVYEAPEQPIGTSKEESQRLQRLLFANYRFTNIYGETLNLQEIFAHEKAILPPEEWFNSSHKPPIGLQQASLPPSGAGDCCAPKLLQYAFSQGLQPLAMAEFWIGASPRNELRREGCFYTPCSGKCVPILRHMLRGTDALASPNQQRSQTLCAQIETIYEDAYLQVVNKPAGLLSVPGKTREVSVAEYLSGRQKNPYLRPVHRLDQDTSGLLVLAKSPETYTTLQAYFQRRDILKRYEAVLEVQGADSRITNAAEGIITLPLLPNPYDRPRQMVDKEHGKPAITEFCVRERRANDTVFVDFYPRTGRTHQLRVHAAHSEGLNAPIAGDRLYGHGSSGENGRMLLHAAEIQFVHPVTKEEMHFCIPSGF